MAKPKDNKKRKNWKVIFKGKIEDFNPTESLEYWRKRTAIEKCMEVKRLADHVMKMKGQNIEYVSGLLRATAVLKRP